MAQLDVKALEWMELGGPSRFWPKTWYGSGILRANYKVEQSHPDGPWFSVGKNFPEIEAAKDAAQEAFKTEILSALEHRMEAAPPLVSDDVLNACASLSDIAARADDMGIGLAKFPVDDVNTVLRVVASLAWGTP